MLEEVFEIFLLGVMFEVEAFFVCTLDHLHKGC